MSKHVRVIAAIVCLGFMITMFSSCSTINVTGNAKLIPSTQEGTKIAEKRVWYALWGLVPISNNTTDDIVPANTNVRVETKYTFLDVVISIFTGLVTINCHTAEVYEVK
ncbi:MAG: hypothetical protein NTU69_08230 [Proteobacteria bacterium]|nr:hypothetical protein [Pseudomonadota bacterium]